MFIHVKVLLSHTYDGNQRCEMEGYGDRNRSIGKQKDEYLMETGISKRRKIPKVREEMQWKENRQSVETTIRSSRHCDKKQWMSQTLQTE